MKASKKKAPPKKMTPKQQKQRAVEDHKAIQEPTREELREILQKEPVGSVRAMGAAVQMAKLIEKEVTESKSKKVQYFPKLPPFINQAPPLPETKIADNILKKFDRQKKEKVHPKLAKQVKAKELPEIPQVTLAEICKKLKLEPTEVRKALRASKTPKPGAQWSWPVAETPRLWKLVEKVHKDRLKDQK